jgi:hypothetical protein
MPYPDPNSVLREGEVPAAAPAPDPRSVVRAGELDRQRALADILRRRAVTTPITSTMGVRG